ncbi:MAG: 50S ribosomal protein L11 methyltransferase [Bacteroidales bacterium]|jgi:ribosomal protein L11 methyltransferase|nr:50S ribosomal protein L11 methyltransferase [Bacteroidales bacterium]
MSNYIEVSFNIAIKDSDLWAIDILKDELLSIGFESFVDEGKDFKGYIAAKDYDNKALTDCLAAFYNEYNNIATITFDTKTIEQQNWNQTWEKAYESVIFGNFCAIRPPFNEPVSNVKYDIIIEPKMSFGTAHHPTTALMITLLSKEKNTGGKTLMDMGCGTAVLAVLAKKTGFTYVEAVDNDDWAVENAIANAKANNADIKVLHLNHWKPQTEYFDVFLANINRNTLIENMKTYCDTIKAGGKLILSGFYEEDCDKVIASAAACCLHLTDKQTDNKWAALTFEKE